MTPASLLICSDMSSNKKIKEELVKLLTLFIELEETGASANLTLVCLLLCLSIPFYLIQTTTEFF